jgi:hypothetical protein
MTAANSPIDYRFIRRSRRVVANEPSKTSKGHDSDGDPYDITSHFELGWFVDPEV